MKKSMILLKVLQKTHDDQTNLCEYLDQSMVDICREGNVSPHQVIFIFLSFQ